MKYLLFWLCAALACTGCTSYRSRTVAPPSRVAVIDDSSDVLRISQGVAIAFDCRTEWGNPCSDNQAKSENEKVARAFPAYFTEEEGFSWRERLTTPSYVVVGVGPGETIVHIGDEELRVVVLP